MRPRVAGGRADRGVPGDPYRRSGGVLGGLATLLAGCTVSHRGTDAGDPPVLDACARRLWSWPYPEGRGAFRRSLPGAIWWPRVRGLIAVKVTLLIGIAMLGAFNRWRTVPKAASDLGPLRRTAAVEVTIALLTVIAGFLGALPPTAASRAMAGIDASDRTSARRFACA